MSPGLLRARAPFRMQNAITGLVLAGFATAVWAYSIRAVKQDDFSDVDEEAREMMMIKGGEGNVAVDVVGAGVGVDTGVGAPPEYLRSSDLDQTPRGVLAPLLDRAFPRLLDPTRKTLVWGAPPIDAPGQMRPRGSVEER